MICCRCWRGARCRGPPPTSTWRRSPSMTPCTWRSPSPWPGSTTTRSSRGRGSSATGCRLGVLWPTPLATRPSGLSSPSPSSGSSECASRWRARYEPVMGKSQVRSLTQISYLARDGFKSVSNISNDQISNPHFSSNPKSFTVKSQIKSQIFHENKYVNKFSIESEDSDIWRSAF